MPLSSKSAIELWQMSLRLRSQKSRNLSPDDNMQAGDARNCHKGMCVGHGEGMMEGIPIISEIATGFLASWLM